MKIFYTLFVVMILSVSCKKSGEGQQVLPAQNYSNIAYGQHASQKMDVYLPQGRNTTDTKVIILLHGGGWMEGDKMDFSTYISELQTRLPDYAIFNINYRLAATGTNLFPSQENDVKAAVEFIRSKKDEYAISDDYVMLGASAGAHLALLHSYKYDAPVKVKAVVSFFGPTDLVDMYNNPLNPLVPLLLSTITGATPASNPGIYHQSSPISFVTAQSPPTLLLHGGIDPVVALSQSTRLRDKLQMNGVNNGLVVYPSEGHGWFGANLDDSFDRIEAFLDAQVP
jgi:acetyl esterase/lipase